MATWISVFFILLVPAGFSRAQITQLPILDGDVGDPAPPAPAPAPGGSGSSPNGSSNGGNANGSGSAGNKGSKGNDGAKGGANGSANGSGQSGTAPAPAPDPCIARVQTAAQTCQGSYSRASTSCDGDNSEFSALRQEGNQLSGNLSSQANIRQSSSATADYQARYSAALGNYSAACSSAITSCESSCTPPMAPSSCPSMSEALRGMQGRRQTCSTTLRDQLAAAEAENKYVQNTIDDATRNLLQTDAGKTGGALAQTTNETSGSGDVAAKTVPSRRPLAGFAGSSIAYDTSAGRFKPEADPRLAPVTSAEEAGREAQEAMRAERARLAREAALKAASSTTSGGRGGFGSSLRRSWAGRMIRSTFGGLFGGSDEGFDKGAKAAGQDMPDLRQFLPGQLRDPRATGLAGLEAAGIQGSHTNIFEQVHLRYQRIEGTLFQE